MDSDEYGDDIILNALKIEYDLKKLLEKKEKYNKIESTFVIKNVVNVKHIGQFNQPTLININIFNDINELKVRILSFDDNSICIDILPNNDIEFISKINNDFKIIDEKKINDNIKFIDYYDSKYWALTMVMRGYKTKHYLIDDIDESNDVIVKYNKNNTDVYYLEDIYDNPEYRNKYNLVMWSDGSTFENFESKNDDLENLNLKNILQINENNSINIQNDKKEVLVYDNENDFIECSYVLIEHNENESDIDTYESSLMTKYTYGGKLFTIIRSLTINCDPKKCQGSDGTYYDSGYTIYTKIGTLCKGLVLLGNAFGEGQILGWESALNEGYFVPDLNCNCENNQINIDDSKTFYNKLF